MKTLKQLLIEKDNFNYKSMTYQDICNIVEKLLKQKKPNSSCPHCWKATHKFKEELLKEFKEKF